MNSNYNSDFVLWCEDTIEYIKRKEWGRIDAIALIDELEDMSKSERRALMSYIVVVMTDLLKIKYQPGKLSKSWINSIKYLRINIQRLFKRSPKLRAEIGQLYSNDLDSLYKQASIIFEEDTGKLLASLPEVCPFSIDEILDEDFFTQEKELKAVVQKLIS